MNIAIGPIDENLNKSQTTQAKSYRGIVLAELSRIGDYRHVRLEHFLVLLDKDRKVIRGYLFLALNNHLNIYW